MNYSKAGISKIHIDGEMEQEVPQGCPGGCGDD